MRDQPVYSRNHTVQCWWSSRGIETIDRVGRGFLCQVQIVKFIPTLCSNSLNLYKKGDFSSILQLNMLTVTQSDSFNIYTHIQYTHLVLWWVHALHTLVIFHLDQKTLLEKPNKLSELGNYWNMYSHSRYTDFSGLLLTHTTEYTTDPQYTLNGLNSSEWERNLSDFLF